MECLILRNTCVMIARYFMKLALWGVRVGGSCEIVTDLLKY